MSHHGGAGFSELEAGMRVAQAFRGRCCRVGISDSEPADQC